MKKLNRNLIYAVIVLFLMGLISGCQDSTATVDSSNSFEVLSTGGPVSGIYKINSDGDDVPFVTTQVGATTYYSFQKNLDNPDTIYINAAASDISVHSITILLYEDSVLKESPLVSQTDSTVEIITAILSYTFNQTTKTK